MTQHHHRGRRASGRALLISVAGTAGLMTAGAAPVDAAPAGVCEATLLRLSVLGAPAVAASRAGSATAPCIAEDGSVDVGAVGAVAASAGARTTVTQHAAASAQASVADLRIGADGAIGALTGPLLAGPDALGAELTAAVSPLLAPGGAVAGVLAPLEAVGLDVVGLDATRLLAEAGVELPAALLGSLPDLVAADMVSARAAATCLSGTASLAGSTALTGLTVLGSPIDGNDPAELVLSLDTADLALADLISVEDVLRSVVVQAAPLSPLGLLVGGGRQSLHSLLTSPSGGALAAVNTLLPGGTTLATLMSTLDTALQPLLAQGRIALPDGILRAVVTPRSEVLAGGRLTETAVGVTITALTQPILSGAIARAEVAADAVTCLPPAPAPAPAAPPEEPAPVVGTTPPAKAVGEAADPVRYPSDFAEEALRCDGVRLRLLDVHRAGSRTHVDGVAERRYVGRVASIYLEHGHVKVGTTRVKPDGTFSTRVRLPAASIRETSKARYYAVISGRPTRSLKFTRRMEIDELSVAAGRITFAGRTTLPRARNQAAIKVEQRVSCRRYKTVATIRPDARGRFSVSFKAPAGATMGVYRAQTFVPSRSPSRRLEPTYTLPRLLALRR